MPDHENNFFRPEHNDNTPDLELSHEELNSLFTSLAGALTHKGAISRATDLVEVAGELPPIRFLFPIPVSVIHSIFLNSDSDSIVLNGATASYMTRHYIGGSIESPEQAQDSFAIDYRFRLGDSDVIAEVAFLVERREHEIDGEVQTNYQRNGIIISPNDLTIDPSDHSTEALLAVIDDYTARYHPLYLEDGENVRKLIDYISSQDPIT